MILSGSAVQVKGFGASFVSRKKRLMAAWRSTIEPSPRFGMLVRPVIVEDDVDDLADRNLGLDGVQETNELLMPRALHAAPDDLAVEHIECGEQGGGAIAFVVVRHRAGPPLLQRQAGLGATKAWIWLFSSTESTMVWVGGST